MSSFDGCSQQIEKVMQLTVEHGPSAVGDMWYNSPGESALNENSTICGASRRDILVTVANYSNLLVDSDAIYMYQVYLKLLYTQRSVIYYEHVFLALS